MAIQMSKLGYILLIVIWGMNCSFGYSQEQEKKLIHLGIDTPAITSLPSVVSQLEETPFDGWVFKVTSDSPRGRERQFDFTWEGWGRRAFNKQELQPTVDALKQTHFTKLTDNFVCFVTTPADVDWYDNFDAILNNVRLAGWIAKEGGLKGVVFDTEEYTNPLFDYHKQIHADSKDFQAYAKQVRQRGAEVMRAFQTDYPDITIFLLFGNAYMYSKEWPAMHGGPAFDADTNDPKKMEYFCYGLLAPFLDGMIEAAGPNVVLIDGTEQSYLTLRRKQFIQHRRAFEQHVLPFVADDEKYAQVFQLGFGVWADARWGFDEDEKVFHDASSGTEFAGWSATRFEKNYWQPDELKLSLINALRETDKYVWLYSERQYYAGDHKNIPPEYEQAIREARTEAGLPP